MPAPDVTSTTAPPRPGTPAVSVIMPAHNQAAYLGEAITSVIQQTFQDWELIIIDDGSTDNTGPVVAGFQDPRLRYQWQENQERSRARNRGIESARAPLIAFLDADDYWLPAYLQTQVAALSDHPECGLSHVGVYDVTAAREIVHTRGGGRQGVEDQAGFLRDMLMDNRLAICCVVVRAACLQTTGLFDPTLRQAEDWDLWLRVLRAYRAVAIPTPLACYRRYNHYLPARLRDRAVEDAYVRILEKFFTQTDDPDLQSLRGPAFARIYWRLAWINFAVADYPKGQQYMHQARLSHPAFFEPPLDGLVDSLAYLADELYDLTTPVEQGLASLDRFFSNLPEWARPLGRLRRAVQGQYWGLQLFRGYERRAWAPVRRAAGAAVAAQPRWLFNRGFLSIWLQALGAGMQGQG